MSQPCRIDIAPHPTLRRPSGDKLEFNRFPDELKALNLIGLVMSGGLVALGFLALLLQASQSI